MKKIVLLSVIICCFLSLKAQKSVTVAVQPPSVCTYDSKMVGNYAGIVASDVKIGDKIVIRGGTPVKFMVKVKNAKGAGKPGKITMIPESTTDVNGNTIPLSGLPIKQSGKGKYGKAFGLGFGLGFTILFPWGLFFLCIKGEDCCYNGAIISCTAVVSDNQQ